ncbi:MAG TPA: prealbumin-like fold domain-containing protein, partial [Nocardioides sp.]
PPPPNPPVTLGLNEFGEAGINLTDAGVFSPNVCTAFGKTYAVSRSSGNSGTAQMKDLVGPGNIDIRNCGRVIIRKVTVPSPDPTDTTFNYTTTGGLDPATFGLKNGESRDYGGAVHAGAYSVTETDPAPTFAFTSLDCSASETGDGTTINVSGATASFNLAANDTVDCTYTNTLQTGAILVTKTRKHAADGPGDHPHAGVDFTVNGVTKTTDANGQACFDGLTFGTYTVHETVPAGYHGEADKDVVVDNTATCSDSPYVGETVAFHNTPLTNLSVSVDSQVPGGTSSTIDCGTAGSAGPGDDITLSADDLEPQTITCTIVIDP